MKRVAHVALAVLVANGVFAQQPKGGSERGFLLALEPLAKRGDTIAQVILGKAYLSGDNVSKDPSEACKWFKQAAEKGDKEAAFILGLLTMDGVGVGEDFSEALKWLRKSAEQGYAKAQTALGDIYYGGNKDTKPDWKEAFVWYRKAAEQGETQAVRMIATMYWAGLDSEGNPREAIKWFRKSAEQNDVRSQYSLGVLYSGVAGVERDYVEAYAWLNLAAAGKASESVAGMSKERFTIDQAKKKLDELEAKLSPQQIGDGQKRTKELKATIESSTRSSADTQAPRLPASKAGK